jgi:hypothetical protein
MIFLNDTYVLTKTKIPPFKATPYFYDIAIQHDFVNLTIYALTLSVKLLHPKVSLFNLISELINIQKIIKPAGPTDYEMVY